MSQFSVVVINYNGKNFLRQCLSKIRESELTPTRVIVVDDASTDNSYEMVKEEFPEFLLLKNEKNSGPTVSRNVGAKKAVGKYIIFLDNDVLVKGNTFEKLVGFVENNPNAGLCGAKFKPEKEKKMWWNMGYDLNIFRDTVGSMFERLSLMFSSSRLIKRLSTPFTLNLLDYDKLRSVDWVAEGCNIVRKELFEKIGGFDERFFMSHEGLDLCRRIRKKGYKIYFNPDVEVELLDGHTHTPQQRKKWLRKSQLLYYKKYWFHLK